MLAAGCCRDPSSDNHGLAMWICRSWRSCCCHPSRDDEGRRTPIAAGRLVVALRSLRDDHGHAQGRLHCADGPGCDPSRDDHGPDSAWSLAGVLEIVRPPPGMTTTHAHLTRTSSTTLFNPPSEDNRPISIFAC